MMRISLWSLLALAVAPASAWILVSPQQHFPRTSMAWTPRQVLTRLTPLASTATLDTANSTDTNTAATLACSTPASPGADYIDLVDFNQALNRYAEAAGDYHRSVVGEAATAEDLWRATVAHPPLQWTPDVVSLNTILKAWARCAQSMAEHRHDRTVDLEHLPTVAVYTAADAAKRAREILEQQERAEGLEGGAAPDVTSYNIVMDAWAKSRCASAPAMTEHLLERLHQHPTLQPDSLSYNAVIDALAYSDREDRLDRLQALWSEMQARYDADPSSPVRPTSRTVNSILHAYSRRMQSREEQQESATKCLQILSRMKATYAQTKDPADQPDAMTYTTVIHALSRCGSLATTQKAEELFQELYDLYKETNNHRFQPTVYTYTVLILAWARTPLAESPLRAEALLQQLLKEERVYANAKSFTATIQAWARSRDVQKSAKALGLLRQMKAMAKKHPEVAPNLITYQTVLDACSRTQGNAEQQTAALKIAFAVFKSIQQEPNMEPNHVIFSTLLRATSFLLPAGEERNQVARAVFGKAVQAGQVDASVIKSLQASADAHILHDLLQPMQDEQGNIQREKIPAAWSKNIRI